MLLVVAMLAVVLVACTATDKGDTNPDKQDDAGKKEEGTLIDVSDDEIKIEQKTGKGNKMTKQTTTILFNQIKHTTVLITF